MEDVTAKAAEVMSSIKTREKTALFELRILAILGEDHGASPRPADLPRQPRQRNRPRAQG